MSGFGYVTVWDAAEAVEEKTAPSYVKLRVRLMFEIMHVIQQRGLKQTDVCVLLSIPQGQASLLMNGKIHLFSLDKLSMYADKLGIKHDIQFK